MVYFGWCDGAVLNDEETQEKLCVSVFIIMDDSNNEIHKQKILIENITTSIDAEYMALLLMLHKIKELGLQNFKVVSDCLPVVNDFKEKHLIKKGKIPYRQFFFEAFGSDFLDRARKSLVWKKRKKNRSHTLIQKQDMDCIIIDGPQLPITYYDEKNIQGDSRILIQTYKKIVSAAKRNPKNKRMKKLTEDLYFTVPDSTFKITHSFVEKFNRSIHPEKYNTTEKTLELLNRKICSSSLFKENGEEILVTGKLHMKVRQGIITDFTMKKSKWSELLLMKKEAETVKLQKHQKIELKKIRIKPDGDSVILPKSLIRIERKIIDKIHRSREGGDISNLDETIKFIDNRLQKSLKVKEANYEVYIYGKSHLFVAHNMVQAYKTFVSQWSILSKVS